jgi:uncharacterized cupredoxin-like copper-binding protein
MLSQLSRKVLSILSVLFVLPLLVTGNHLKKETNHERVSAHNHALHTINVDVTLGDYFFKPDTIRVQAGHKVVLHLKNKGTVEHEFMVGKWFPTIWTILRRAC